MTYKSAPTEIVFQFHLIRSGSYAAVIHNESVRLFIHTVIMVSTQEILLE
jgi:hypothetical protein